MLTMLQQEFDILKDGESIVIVLNQVERTFTIKNNHELKCISGMVIINQVKVSSTVETIYIPEDSILYFKKLSK